MIRKGTFEELSLYSASLQETVPLLAYLPAAFTPLYKHTLVIAQDGTDYVQFAKAASALDALQEQSEIDRTIFVGIPYRTVENRREKYAPNGRQNQAYIRFLGHELASYLDDRYPTYQMGKGRVLLGDSLGGTVSLMAAFTYPHTFGKVIMQSPFINDDVLRKVRNFQNPHLLDLYHSVGTKETSVKTTDGQIRNFIEPNRALHRLMLEKQLHALYHEFDGDHTWKYWQQDLPRAFSSMLTMK